MDLERKTELLLEGLEDAERTWLDRAVGRYLGGNEVDARLMKASLDGEIPRGFDPESIDGRLLGHDGRPTPLALLASGKEGLALDSMQRVARRLREIAVGNAETERRDVEASEVAEDLGMDETDARLIFQMLFDVGLVTGIGGNQEGDAGPATISVNGSSFDELYAFDGNLGRYLQTKYFRAPEPEGDAEPPDERGASAHVINPIFEGRVGHVDRRLGFVLMPFTEEWSQAVYDKIRQFLDLEGYQCLRADESHGSFVMEDVWTKINQAGFVVADLTGLNPNVTYELGVAHTVGKPTVLITQNVGELPFDLQHLRVIEYADEAGGTDVLEQLPDAVEEAKREREQRDEEAGIPLESSLWPRSAYARIGGPANHGATGAGFF